jgi:hypothetical protein
MDSSDDSYVSYQPSNEEEMEEEDEEHLATLLAWSPSRSEKVPPPVNRSTMHSPTGAPPFVPEEPEYRNYDDELQLSTSEMAMLELLILYDSSGAHRDFYDDLLMLLRRHIKRGFVITKAKGHKVFINDMRKKVLTPKPKTTMVDRQEVFRLFFPRHAP